MSMIKRQLEDLVYDIRDRTGLSDSAVWDLYDWFNKRSANDDFITESNFEECFVDFCERYSKYPYLDSLYEYTKEREWRS